MNKLYLFSIQCHAMNIPEQGLRKEQHGMHYFCSHFSQHQFPSVSFVRPEIINQGSLKSVN